MLMGVWWGGGVLNPVNTRWSVPEIVYSLDDCDTGILVVDDHFLSRVEGIRATAKRPPLFIYAGDGPAPEGMPSLRGADRSRRSRSRTRTAPAPTWPASCTPAAPPASPRA